LDVLGTDADESGAGGPARLWNGRVELADNDRGGAGTAAGTVTCGWTLTLRLIWVKRLMVEYGTLILLKQQDNCPGASCQFLLTYI